ncbi:MAG: tetratricopeptide repeat protein [bacterium]|nr:tetratricopeptide repeat protein [bacterium]
MSQAAAFQRAILLYQQHRWDLAVAEFRRFLTGDPENAQAHAFLAFALVQLDDLDAALESARQAVKLAPDEELSYAALATAHAQREEFDDALTAIQTAIRIDPDDASLRGREAQIHLHCERWQQALDAANAGLALEPHDSDCLNLRSVALTRLGRGDEATDTLDASLARDPDNPYTHQSRGYALLQQRDIDGALHHFQEALRRDPTLDGARAGLAEAIKARNPVYRWVLAWYLWLGRFPPARRIQILVGAWVGALLIGRILESAGLPEAAGVARYSWLIVVLLTACAVPLFNLLLLLHPLGRHALDPRSRRDAMVLGLAFLGALFVSSHALFAAPAPWSHFGWLFWWLALLPISAIGLFHNHGRTALQVFSVGLVGAWVWWAISIESIDFSRGAPDQAVIDLHASWIQNLLLAAALSTWFVLLAPKGRRRRSR